MNETAQRDSKPFWVLVIESKNSSIDLSAGLPQLLTYAFKSLAYQESVWGLVTNGLRYQFVYLRQATPPTYQLMPDLNLLETEILHHSQQTHIPAVSSSPRLIAQVH
jgi:hypothetical protein